MNLLFLFFNFINFSCQFTCFSPSELATEAGSQQQVACQCSFSLGNVGADSECNYYAGPVG